jgi:predicted transcriptional regulator
MGKAKSGVRIKNVSVRLSNEQLERIDALAERYSTPWRKESRANLMQFLLLQALERAEQNEALVVMEFPRANGEGSSI